MDGGDVRLRSGSRGLINLDVRAPVRSGRLVIGDASATLDLVIALDQISTGNFFTEQAARAMLAGYRVQDLVYSGSGPWVESAFGVSGQAQAGTMDVTIHLAVTPPSSSTTIELTGSAGFGAVHIPGIGAVDDFIVEVDAVLEVRPA
jgi:hypothetical protein